MIHRHLLFGTLLSLATVGAANASIITTVSPTGAPATGVTYESFNASALGSTGGTTASGIAVSFAGTAAVVNGSLTNNYAAPVFSNGNGAAFGNANGTDTTNYIAVGNGSATLSFSTAQNFLGLLWGSVDSYNTLTFYSGANGTGTVVGSVNGSNVVANANGNMTASGTVYVDTTSTTAFQSVVASSTKAAFEFDNVSFGTVAVPEPVSMSLLGSALLGTGLVRKLARRRRS